MDTLSYVNVFVRDIEALPDFYAAVFGLAEAVEQRSGIFRALLTGASAIGFNGPEAYALLGLEPAEAAAGVRFALTFDVPAPDEVAPRAARAVALGARLVKGPYRTAYGTVQAVLTDPEDNVFRINAAR
ncbi:MAG: VOC family protein [Caulobacteraceae bacterium]|nr:VOC family protein [Caulobacteraceae bacterium]